MNDFNMVNVDQTNNTGRKLDEITQNNLNL